MAAVEVKFVAKAVTVTFRGPVSAASGTGVTSNVAVKAPAGIVTLAGTAKVEGEEDTRFTVRAVASGLEMLTVPAPA
jgi:hypothetical protein